GGGVYKKDAKYDTPRKGPGGATHFCSAQPQKKNKFNRTPMHQQIQRIKPKTKIKKNKQKRKIINIPFKPTNFTIQKQTQ
ncbi:hypothetical protein ACQWF7_25585, partial [Salmonella enterica subsp. enterica serovar Infantis]